MNTRICSPRSHAQVLINSRKQYRTWTEHRKEAHRTAWRKDLAKKRSGFRFNVLFLIAGATSNCRTGKSSCLATFNNHRVSLAHADTHCNQRIALVFLFKRNGSRIQNTGSTHSKRMSECNSTSVWIYPWSLSAPSADTCPRLKPRRLH